MWIAKPINALSTQEQYIWNEIENILPISQTLGWANAIEALGGRVFLAFSTAEKIGGVVFTQSGRSEEKLHFECINGPHLHWDDPKNVPRQLATFAMAVSKLDPNFGSLILKPRWEEGLLKRRLPLIPIPVYQTSHAATVVIPIQHTHQDQFTALSPRMQRTLKRIEKTNARTFCERVTKNSLSLFIPKLQALGKEQSFTVPPFSWFHTLAQSHELWLIRSKIEAEEGESSECQILILRKENRAYYLFGYENRSRKLRSAMSLSAFAQWAAIKKCAELRVSHYDLNGYVVDALPQHPYYGVCQFKKQFSGAVIKYDIPEFVIQ